MIFFVPEIKRKMKDLKLPPKVLHTFGQFDIEELFMHLRNISSDQLYPLPHSAYRSIYNSKDEIALSQTSTVD